MEIAYERAHLCENKQMSLFAGYNENLLWPSEIVLEGETVNGFVVKDLRDDW